MVSFSVTAGPASASVGFRRRLSIVIVVAMVIISASHQQPTAAAESFGQLVRRLKHSIDQIGRTSQGLRQKKPDIVMAYRFLKKHQGMKRAMGGVATVVSGYGTYYCIKHVECNPPCIDGLYHYYDKCSDCMVGTFDSGKLAFRPSGRTINVLKALIGGGKCLHQMLDAASSPPP